MKDVGARWKWKNALAVVVLPSVLSVTFAPAVTFAQYNIPEFPTPGLNDLVNPATVAQSSPSLTGVLATDLAGIGSPAVTVGVNAVASTLPAAMCATYTYVEGYRFCWDHTFGFPTPGMCVGTATCLGLGTVAITGVAIGIGKGIVGKILGGNGSSESNVPAGGMSLAGGSKYGCSGTPYISTTPSTDSCAVYIPTGATASSTLNLNGLAQAPSVSSLLFSNTSGTGTSSSVSNTLLNTGTNSANTSSQTSVGNQLLANPSVSGGTGATSLNATGGALLLNGQGQGTTASPGTGVGNSSTLSGIGSALWNSLFGGNSTAGTGTDLLNTLSGNTDVPAKSVSALLGDYGTGAQAGASSKTVNIIPPKPSGVQSGTWGDILAGASGVTITVGGHGADNRTGTGAFYGYDTVPGVQPMDLAKQMCVARPWAKSSATAVIPASYYDSICTARGYTTSAAPATPPAAVSNTGTGAGVANKKPGTTNSQASTVETASPASTKPSLPVLPAGLVLSMPPPSVTITALPPRVRIASRSTIYWSAKGVTACAVTSPDGSFNGNTLSGAASTVALYDNTVFTITCTAFDGSTVSKSVTVETSS